MIHRTPKFASASALQAHFAGRGVRLSVEYVTESDDTHWWRVWLRDGDKRPGDFEAVSRVKNELVELLRAQGRIEKSRPKPRRRHPLKSRTPIWEGPAIPPLYRSLVNELHRPMR